MRHVPRMAGMQLEALPGKPPLPPEPSTALSHALPSWFPPWDLCLYALLAILKWEELVPTCTAASAILGKAGSTSSSQRLEPSG